MDGFMGSLLLLFFLISSQANAGQLIKVLTLNFNSEIVMFDDSDGKIRDMRFQAMVEWVKSVEPDIILFQEAWNYNDDPSVAIRLAQAINYDQYNRLDEGFPGLMYDSNAVLAKKELRLVQGGVKTLSHSADFIGDTVTWIIPFGTISRAVGVKLQMPDGSPLFIYSTHLIGSSASDRGDQARDVDNWAEKRASKLRIPWDQANVIVAGDLNSTPLQAAPTYFKKNGYEDTWAVAHPDHVSDDLGTTNCGDPNSPRFNPLTLGANQYPAQTNISADARIDYIFSRGPKLKVMASTIEFTHPYGGTWMSDHYGLLTTFAWNGGNSLSIANPTSDSESFQDPTAIVSVTKNLIEACANRSSCSLLGRNLKIGDRGITIVNRLAGGIHVKIKGNGQVFPSVEADLSQNQAASFFFIENGQYGLEISDDGNELQTELSFHYP